MQADGDAVAAERHWRTFVAAAPEQPDGWFALSLLHQDRHDLVGAEAALRQVIVLAPTRVEAFVDLGIVLQDAGRPHAALRAFGRAYRLREDTFGRIAHALAASPRGALWLELDALRSALREAAPP